MQLTAQLVAYRFPGVSHDANQQVQEDDCHHKQVEDEEGCGCFRVGAVIEDLTVKAGNSHHEGEHG